MLRIYPVIIECVVALRPTLAKIESKDSDLGKQMRRALQSVPLTSPRARRVAAGIARRGITPLRGR